MSPIARALPPSIPVLVTGASSGLGAEFARRLAARGPIRHPGRAGEPRRGPRALGGGGERLTVQQLTAAVLPGLIAARAGGIIDVASTSSFQPIPCMATYAATKAFVLSFTEAVAGEVRRSGVMVMALCAGPVRTEFDSIAGTQDYMRLAAPMTMDAGRCVGAALQAFDRGSTVCIPGVLNATMAQGARIAPRFLRRRITGTVMGRRR